MIRELTGIAGVGLVSAGAWSMYRPAGLIVAGIFVIVYALFGFDRTVAKTGN